MYLQRPQRKLILLYARLRELEATREMVNGGRIGRQERTFVLEREGRKPQGLVNIRALEEKRASRLPNTDSLEEFDDAVVALFPGVWPNDTPVSDKAKTIDVDTFGMRIGFKDPSRVRYVIDHDYASMLPTFSAVTQPNGEADEFTETHGGLYLLYRHDANDSTHSNGVAQSVVTRATLSIRYPVPYKPHESDQQGTSRIRCRLNIPPYQPGAAPERAEASSAVAPDDTALYRYDGYVGSKGEKWWHFLLQARQDSKRSRHSEDLILMYTERFAETRPARDTLEMVRGVMLTQNQEQDFTPTVSTIVLIRVADYLVQKLPWINRDLPGAKKLPPRLLDHYALMKKTSSGGVARDDERPFMRGEPGIVDLSAPGTWTKTDAFAVSALFAGWNGVNVRGLHA